MSKFKILICLLIGMIFMLPNCSALIPKSELTLAGIFIDDDFSKVKRIYGEPVKIIQDNSSYGSDKTRIYTYYYGDESFYVVISSYRGGKEKVLCVGTTANNGIATKSGIRVGMTRQQLISIYGPPDQTDIDSYGKRFYMYGDYVPSRGSVSPSLDFYFNGDVITKISLSRYID